MLHRGGREAPPPMRVEHWEPRKGYVCVNGRWGWNGTRYDWEPGRYERERVGFRWREPRWEVRDGVYVRVEGDWIARGPTVAPPAVRVERWEPRRGFVWIRGRHAWVNGAYVWMPGHYEKERAGYVWREPRWEMRDGVYVKVEGSWVIR